MKNHQNQSHEFYIEQTKCQHKLLMGEENNRCKTKHFEIVLLLMSRRQKSETSQRFQMASLSNIYIGVIGVPLAQENQ